MRHQTAVKIYYEDTDCSGAVYYANYLRYMEMARTEYMAARGCSVKSLMGQNIFFVVTRVETDYLSPVKYGETLVIDTWISAATAATLLFEHTMREQASGKLVVTSSVRGACLNAESRPQRVPREIVKKLYDGPRRTPPGMPAEWRADV